MENYDEIQQELSLLTQSEENSIDERIEEQEVIPIQSLIAGILRSTPDQMAACDTVPPIERHQISYLRIENKQSLDFIFEHATRTREIEIPARPGDLSLLHYASNVRLSSFVTLQDRLQVFNTVYVLINNTGLRYTDWKYRINAIKAISEPHLWWDNDEESREADIHHWIDDDINSTGIVSFPQLNAHPAEGGFRFELSNDSIFNQFPGPILELHNEDRIEYEREHAENSEIQITDRIHTGWTDHMTPVQHAVYNARVHYRFTSPILQQIHIQCSLPIVYTDILLNLLNQFCIEFEFMVSEANKIAELRSNDHSDFRKAFVILNTYVLCLQPPFVLAGSDDRNPILHLRCFFSALIKGTGIVDDLPVNLPLLRRGDQLNITSYAAMIEAIYQARDDLCKEQLVSTTPSPRRPNRPGRT